MAAESRTLKTGLSNFLAVSDEKPVFVLGTDKLLDEITINYHLKALLVNFPMYRIISNGNSLRITHSLAKGCFFFLI